jgi:hypothetical protein
MRAKVKLQVKQTTTVYYQFEQHLQLSGILLFSRPQNNPILRKANEIYFICA